MVYLDLSVRNVDEAVDFYSVKLGIFSQNLDQRLICSIGVDLIIELFQCGSEEHRKVFEQDLHVPSSFWISPNSQDRDFSLEILGRLQAHNVSYKRVGNLGGVYLHFKDPSGNKFSLRADHGCIK